MRTGWEIVIAGRNFDPTEFFGRSGIQPSRLGLREERDGWTRQVVDFTDWREGRDQDRYSLDMATEALDYLKANRQEFEELCTLPGVEERILNFVGLVTRDGAADDFVLSPSDLSLLADLGFSVSFCTVCRLPD